MKKQNITLTTSKQLILGATLLATLSSTAFAGQAGVQVGYTSASMGGVSTSGVSIGYGAHFGETYKQSVGFSIDFLGKENDANEDKGNIGNFYYSLGYEVLPKTVVYGTVGYGMQSLGTVGTGSNKTSVYATGLSTGVGVEYNINKNFALDASYRNYALSHANLDYDIQTTNVSLVYKY